MLLFSVDKGVGKRVFCYFIGGNVNWYSLLEDGVLRCIINLKFCICMSLGFFFGWENRKFNFYDLISKEI